MSTRTMRMAGIRHSTLLAAAREFPTATPAQWVRHSGSYRQPRRGGGRKLKLLAVLVASGAAGWMYASGFHKDEDEEKKAGSAQAAQAEIVFEKDWRQPVSTEDNRTLLSSQHAQVKKSWENPGVYAWGSNSGKVVAPDSKDTYVKAPRRIPYFDGRLLRDLKLDRDFGAAVTEDGDLVQWGIAFSKTSTGPVVTLKGKNLVKVAASQDRIIALSSDGSVYSVPVAQSEQVSGGEQPAGSSWIPSFWSSPPSVGNALSLKPENLGWRERVVDISSGREHCLMLTSSGRVFSAASSAESFPSKGQLGVPGLTWANRPPGPYYRAHEVATPGGAKIVRIATGDLHSLVLDREGRVCGFGDNSAGQLGVQTELATPYVDTPSPLPIQQLYSGTGLVPRVTSIAAGGLNTFFTVDATLTRGTDASTGLVPARAQPKVVADTWACGEGIYGSLGTGKWTHVSLSPSKIKALSGLYEFDQATDSVVPIRLAHLAVGSAHTSAIMDNVANVSARGQGLEHDTNWGSDVLWWGKNASYQLGTGKRNNESTPVYIAPLDDAAGDSAKGRKGETHRLQITPRTTVRLGEGGNGRRASVEQRVECGREVTAVYSGT